MTQSVEIVATGHYAPDRIVTSSEIESRLGLSEGWIAQRTGIDARRYAAEDQALSDLAVAAGAAALTTCGIARDSIALVLLATSTPDHLLPPTAPLVAHRLGLRHAGGIDLAGACGGFVYALSLAASFASLNRVPVLVIAANILSRRINAQDRNTSILFADGAGAVIVQPSTRPDAGLIGTHLVSDGAAYGMIQIPAGGSSRPLTTLDGLSDTLMVIADGQAVYTEAVAMMTDAARIALERADLAAAEVDHFIPHQANARMMATIASRLQIAPQCMRSSIANYGNSSAATIPLTLSTTLSAQPIARGDVVLMTAAGAGLTGGAIVWRW